MLDLGDFLVGLLNAAMHGANIYNIYGLRYYNKVIKTGSTSALFGWLYFVKQMYLSIDTVNHLLRILALSILEFQGQHPCLVKFLFLSQILFLHQIVNLLKIAAFFM